MTRSPSIDEATALWIDLSTRSAPLRLEDAFELAIRHHGYDPEYSLSNLQHALIDAKRHDDLIALARAVLASGAEFPTNWMPALADALIATDRLDEAELVVRDVIGTIESYKSEMLVTAMRYERARGNRADEEVAYHAGKRWFTNFVYSKKRAATFGKAPKDLAAQFGRWLERWLANTYWDAVRSDQLGHWLVWFDEIESPVIEPHRAAFIAERDRRNALYEQLEKARDNAASRELLERAKQFPGDTDLVQPLAHKLVGRAPHIAHELLLHAIASERRTGYRYPTGERVLSIVNLTFLTLSVPALADKMAEAYEIALGYVLTSNATVHYNLGCLAARLGKREAALEHIARALERKYEDPKKIHDDSDLASLRGDPAFEDLFLPRSKRSKASPPAMTPTSRAANKKRPIAGD